MPSVSESIINAIYPLTNYYTIDDLNALFDINDKNVRSLGALIDTAQVGSALFSYNVALDASVQVGQPVYFDTTSNTFKLSKLQTINSGGRLHASESSEAWGLVVEKCAADRGHILLSGLAKVDLTFSTQSASPKGKYYLSKTQGKLNTQPDDAIVSPVLFALGDGQVLFRPWFADTYPRYIPRQLSLKTAYAASGVTTTACLATLTSPNPVLAGWLPASHASFAGHAPVGATFGYNLAADPTLREAWPPLEPELAKLYFDVGGTGSAGASVMLGGKDNRVIIDQYGIWWMTARPGQLPWDYIPEEHPTELPCPQPWTRKLTLECAFGLASGAYETIVSSLSSRVPWMQFQRPPGSQEASTGPLSLTIKPEELLNTVATDTYPLALKRMVDGRFNVGPVVSTIRSSSPGLLVSGGVATDDKRYGEVVLSLAAIQNGELSPAETQLFGATTESYSDTMAIGLPSSRNTNFVVAFHIPLAIQGTTNVAIQLWLLAPLTLTLPAGLTCTSRILAQPSGSAAVAIAAEQPLNLTYPAGTSLTAGTYIQVATDNIVVHGGDTIYVRIARAGATDGIGGDLHVLKTRGLFVGS